jgi:signal transduction histidine kinase
MSTLPADFPTCPIRRGRHTAADRRDTSVDGPDLRGVLHDVGHGLFTLSLLLDNAQVALLPQLGADAFELLEQEISRLLAIVHSGARRSAEPVPVGLRSLLEPFAVVCMRTTLAKVWVRPGPEFVVATDPGMLWRIIANLIDNAVRAAGPLGNVEIVVNDRGRLTGHHFGDDLVTIDVIDDGPGFQRGPSGLAQLGLTVVNRLLDACGGRLQIDEVRPHGTRMRVILPAGGPPAGRSKLAGGTARVDRA